MIPTVLSRSYTSGWRKTFCTRRQLRSSNKTILRVYSALRRDALFPVVSRVKESSTWYRLDCKLYSMVENTFFFYYIDLVMGCILWVVESNMGLRTAIAIQMAHFCYSNSTILKTFCGLWQFTDLTTTKYLNYVSASRE